MIGRTVYITTFSTPDDFVSWCQVGPYGPANKDFMERFKKYLRDRNLYTLDTTVFALIHDDPRVVPASSCRYEVGAYLKKFGNDLENFEYGAAPSGNYAVFTIEHTSAAIEEFWASLSFILLEHHLLLDSERPLLEMYPVQLVENHLCKVGIPIMSLESPQCSSSSI